MADFHDVLTVELVASNGAVKEDASFHVLASELLGHAEQGYEEMLRRAQGLVAEGEEVSRLTYLDDEGDQCTLNGRTLKDAVDFAELNQATGYLKLRLAIFVMGKSRDSAAADDMNDKEAEGASEREALVEAALQALNQMATGSDLRELIPKLAGAGLRIIGELQDPSLYALIDILCALQEGGVKVDSVPSLLPQFVAAFEQVPADRQADLLDMLKEVAKKVVQELREEQAKEESKEVEVHVHVICDGCETVPILGNRYKSLDTDDFDLCQACYQREDRDASRWVRAKSDVTGSVVASFFGGKPVESVHYGVGCDGCLMFPIVGKRFKCLDLDDFDLCQACWAKSLADPDTAGRRFQEVALGGCVVACGPAIQAMEACSSSPKDNDSSNGSCGGAGEPEDATAEANAKVPEDEEEPSKKDDASMQVEAARVALGSMGEEEVKAVLDNLLQHSDAKVREAALAALRAASEADDDSEEPQEAPPEREREAQEEKEVQAPSEHNTEDEWEIMAEDEPERLVSAPSARILCSAPLTLGIEAQETEDARGDATEEFAGLLSGSGLPTSQAYRVGRVIVPTGEVSIPACAKVVVQNDGKVAWPESAALALVLGEDMGLPFLQLGAMAPGEAAEIILDLSVPPRKAPGSSRCAWALIDATTGATLGPLLLFEAVWSK
eukprot:CAMPEP_0203879530 /NCGR_PEP_ID=MMETSP0359-20131031/23974_1 /ASSEMBLY_ACC=CAM_ASM_000338 /TAXON_ID=268821 /ORGANISM="Scrippsiella Hangoei, Strain SHTV-5" /LENGTH=669 /DNA_ID=CAMNT_0050798971 /DNA_START=53 /DNA_END=2062 /DNA_ORIENTATION=+